VTQSPPPSSRGDGRVSRGVGDIWRVDTGASSGIAGGPKEALEIVGEGDSCTVGCELTLLLLEYLRISLVLRVLLQ